MEEHKKKEYEDIYKNYAGIVYGYLLKKMLSRRFSRRANTGNILNCAKEIRYL